MLARGDRSRGLPAGMAALPSSKLAILFVEDDPAGRELGAYNLRKAGYEVDAVATGEEATATFEPARHAAVVTDLRLPGMSGLEVLRAVKARASEVPVLVITAYGEVEVAVEAMRAGAYDFIGKPFHKDHLLLTVERALERSRLRAEVESLRLGADGGDRPLVSESPEMRRVLELVERVARAEATVLITGETGTGKELVARRIHARSARAEGPFVAVNCAAVPAELMESELFGHERGAFTGAARARPGRFRQASGGTLFLDEIGELPFALQGKLLRALQERVVDVLGRDQPVPVDVRVLAATNRDLAERVREGSFRQDLLYRLDVVEIRVPPLRDRPSDIAPLARHFVARFARGRDLELPGEVIRALEARPWPGNVRQLENACERLVLLAREDVLSIDDLPALPESRGPEPAAAPADAWPSLPPEGLDLVDLERRVIERVLALKQGNVSQSARYLGVPRHVLVYRMAKYGLRRS
jgi:DNA-binding NtrC family response regulator